MVTYKAKAMFFDRKAVENLVGKATAQALSKAGAHLRRRARTSLRRRKRTSAAGSPPSVHSQDAVATLKNILFALEPRNLSVIVGPVALNKLIGGKTVPSIHEFGATVPIRSRRKGRQVVRAATYPPRPFMAPALAAEAPKFPALWGGAVGGKAG